MWRIIPLCLLVLSIVGHSVRHTAIVTEFRFRQAEIATTLCVKKDVPNNTCQGRCHLKKMMKAGQDADRKTPATTVRDLVMPLALPTEPLSLAISHHPQKACPMLTSNEALGVRGPVFRPPKG